MPALPSTPAPAPRPGVEVLSTDWPLLGRETELATISEALGAADAAGVVLHGPGGVGKSRLAVECLRLGEQAGFATARAVATRASSQIALGALAPLLPELSGEQAVNLLGAARAALAALAGDRPLLLFVDDAHLLDDLSASLVLQLAGDDGVFVLVTVRAGEPVSDAITSLWKDGAARRIDVAPLPDGVVDQIVRTVLGGEVGADVEASVRRLSAGNPLALRELVLGAVESGALSRSASGWHLDRPLAVSPRLADLVSERLGSLDAAESDVLEFVALGEPVPLAALERLCRAESIEALEQRGLIRVQDDGTHLDVFPAHPLHGEVVRHGIGTLRTRNVLRSLADALSAAPVLRAGDLMRIATWRLASGGSADPELLLAAARTAFVLLDVEQAARFSQAAWELSHRADAGQLCGHMLLQQGRFEEAEAVLAEVQGMVDTDELRVLTVIARSENLFRMGREDEAFDLCSEQLELVAEPSWRAELLGHRATFLLLGGRPSEAYELVAPYLDPGPDDDLRPLVEAAITAGTALTYDGRPLDALAINERAYAAHQRLWEEQVLHSDPGIQVVGIMQALSQAGRLEQAEGYLAFAWQVAVDQRATMPQAWFSLLYGNHCVLVGDQARAVEWYDRSSALWREVRVLRRLRWTYAGAAGALATLGQLDEARRRLAELDELEASGRGAPGLNEGLVVDNKAWVLALGGALPAARDLLDASADAAVAIGQRTCAMVNLHSLARLGAPERAVDRAAALRDECQGDLLLARADHIGALHRADADGLDEVAARFGAIGARLFAAEAAADAARAHRHAGAGRKANASANRSADWAATCPGVTTPALVLAEAASPLTKREREVALLAAQGMASKVIADTLFLSVRTVDNHLQRVYEKLGVKGRDELAAAVGVSDPT